MNDKKVSIENQWLKLYEEKAGETGDILEMTFQSEWSLNSRIDVMNRHMLKLHPDNLKVLDVGSGPGYYVRFLQKKGYTVFGTDYTFQQLSKSKDLSVGLPEDYTVANIYNLPYKTNYFDILLCFGVFQNIADERAGAEELFRIARQNGGIVFLTTLNKYSVASFMPKILSYFIASDPEKLKFLDGILHRFDPLKLRKVFLEAGFSKVHFQWLFILPGELTSLAKFLNHHTWFSWVFFPLANDLFVVAETNNLP